MSGSAFRFRLERVRAVRERREQLAKQELAQAISLRTSTEAQLRSVEADLEQAHSEQRSVAAKDTTTSATELLARQAFLERIEAERGAHVLELSRRESDVVDRDAKLVHAAGEHEMLKRLRERRREEHDRELARHEGNVLDELTTARFRGSAA